MECVLPDSLQASAAPQRRSVQAATVSMACVATQHVMDNAKHAMLKAPWGHVLPRAVYLTVRVRRVQARVPVLVSVTEPPVPTVHTQVRQRNVALLRAPKVQPMAAELATAWVDVSLLPRLFVRRTSAVAARAAIRARRPLTAS
jgi:hypothetical protein